MAGLAALFDKDVVRSYRAQIRQMDVSPMFNSQAFVTDPDLTDALAAKSMSFAFGYLEPLDTNVEPNYSNTVFNDLAEPRSGSYGEQMGRKAMINESFGVAKLERQLTDGDPLLQFAQFESDWTLANLEHRAQASLVGIQADDNANHGGSLTTDVSTKTGDAALFTTDTFLQATQGMPQDIERRGVIIMHNDKYYDIKRNKLIVQEFASDGVTPIETYNGLAIIRSNRMTKFGAKYRTMIIGAGAFGYAYGDGPDNLATDGSESRGNGGGFNTIHLRKNVIIHPQGYSFTAGAADLTGGTPNEALFANWDDLQKADHWSRIADRDEVAIGFLITK
ncbi:hypothetical protein FQV37_2276 [Psychrobacter nivimaris]|uniref:Major capsid protein n=1 Tax=Psychrobacter nivimaris TaxID=281738 RepID=A0A6N7BXS9_9GAMM|nr:hypothetical protein [Psychrobacter nivimaris]KAF0567420.1 hypothetical protein FQV37_2276 [Psychrobacter nivimaris]